MKDMTSIDCPICGKGVKFDKSQDANVVWDHHYLHDCSQQATSHHEKTVVRCFKPGCNTVLGPSNKFTCAKCHMNVCLAHRIPEEHNCVGPIRKEFLERIQKNMKVGNADKPEKKHEKKHVGIFHQFDKKEKERVLHSNNVAAHGHVHAAAHHTIPILCPFCGVSHESDASLVDHILAFHPDDGHGAPAPAAAAAAPPSVFGFFPAATHSTPHSGLAANHSDNSNNNNNDSNNNPSTGNAALHREVCPACHMRFPDAIALVRHFESHHSERAQQETRSATSTADGTSNASNHSNHCEIS